MKNGISLEVKKPVMPSLSLGGTKIIGQEGENGATFYPEVSEDGIISWTNDKGLDNPKSVNIKGKDGADGKNGVDGKDGYSPNISVSEIPNGNRVTITDKDNVEHIDILNGADGQNGADGVGIKSVEKTANNGEFDTYTFNFTDGKTFSFTIKNGKDGEDGADGRGILSIVKSSTNGLIDNYTINFTDGSKTTFSVTNGKNGVDGTDGKDGAPATHEWQGTTLVITSASGTSSADLKGERGIQGIQGEKGDPFFISKVYNSIAEMNSGYANDGVKIGQFVVIETGNVNDEDNAKLFIKGNTSYEFLTDLSGAQGMQGPAGVQGEQGDQGPAGVQGVGIRSIAKTDTQGIRDIYTITLTDGRTATFSVTNGTNGNDGVSVTNASIDSNGNLVITLSNENELTLGKVVGSNGKDGADGTSVTIERINENTSDGGSSTIFFSDGNSINIKNGATGGKGADGKNGTSVTITKVSESTADGGSNVVNFSDGKTLTVKNGSKGKDYVLTPSDKSEIVAMVVEMLGGNPIFGIVDKDNNIILSGNLADGDYTVKYEMENGSTVNIGSLVLSGSEPEPTYTNLADPTSADWVVGKRFNSSGALVDVDSGVNGATTNYIGGDLVAGDIIRVKNMDLTTYRVAVYDSAKTLKITTPLNNSALASTVENVTVNTTEASFTVKAGSHLTSGGYIRFCGPLTGTSEDVIITKNEEIV